MKKQIQTQKGRIYRLEDEIKGEEGSDIRIEESVYKKFRELVDFYIEKIGLKTKMEKIKKNIENGNDFLFDKFIKEYQELDKEKQLILKIKDKALKKKDGFSIYYIRIEKEKNNSIYFRDIFGKNTGANIENIKQTMEAGMGMAGYISDEYGIKIENSQKGIKCYIKMVKLSW